jgi:serine/threonine protein phosphatase PrpC
MAEQFPHPEHTPESYEPLDAIWTEGFENVRRVEGKNGVLVFGTDIGVGREKNEDALVANTEKDSFAVIDGMGGEEKGEVAARLFAEELQKGFREGLSPEDIQKNAHLRMKKEGVGKGGACYGSISIVDGRLDFAHAGDVDVVVTARKGYIKFQNETEGGAEGVFNVVTGEYKGETSTETCTLNTGDRIYLASDGLWHNINVEELIGRTIRMPAEQAIAVLAEEAKKRMAAKEGRRAPDNITILIYDLTKLS